MADATANILAGKDVGMNVARLALDALAMFSSTSCFVAGTQVIVGINPDGSYREESIETVQEGDRILTRNQYDPDAPLELEQVTAVYRHQVSSLRVITYQDAAGNVETIRTTDDHPFYVQGLGWTGAQYLEAGNVLTTPTGGTAVVIGNVSELLDAPISVYNLQVASDHTYFVEDGEGAQTPVWVHNLCGGTYGEVRSTNSGGEVHHLISDAVAKALKLFSRWKGPAILMEAADHARTLSYGIGDLARNYRAMQAKILAPRSIEAIREALALEMRDLHRLFGRKYNKAILEMLEKVAL